MADGVIPVTPGAGKNLDCEELTVSGVTVERERVQIAGTGDTQLAPVSATLGLSVNPTAIPPGAATAAKQPALGTAGTASADVVSIQGIASMTAVAISAAALPLPSGAATAAKQPALGTAGTASTDVITVQGIASGTVLPISAASLPLPTGASTVAKQPALGTAGTAATDVITVQGIASMTALAVSATALPLPALAATSTKQSDGSQKTQVVDGSGNVIGATSNALDVNIKSGNPTTIAVTQATGTNLHAVVDSGTITTVSTVTAVTAITNALPAGSNAIGKLAANSGVDIGDVDVTSLISTRKSKYGTTATAITCTIASLANAGRRESTAVDNTSNLFEDALVQVKITAGAASTAATGYAEVFAYATSDTTTPAYADGCTGTDAAVTLTVPPNLKLIGFINVVANNGVYVSEPFSVASAFGGVLPPKWGIVVGNQCGGTFAASGCSAWYQGVQGQTT